MKKTLFSLVALFATTACVSTSSPSSPSLPSPYEVRGTVSSYSTDEMHRIKIDKGGVVALIFMPILALTDNVYNNRGITGAMYTATLHDECITRSFDFSVDTMKERYEHDLALLEKSREEGKKLIVKGWLKDECDCIIVEELQKK